MAVLAEAAPSHTEAVSELLEVLLQKECGLLLGTLDLDAVLR